MNLFLLLNESLSQFSQFFKVNIVLQYLRTLDWRLHKILYCINTVGRRSTCLFFQHINIKLSCFFVNIFDGHVSLVEYYIAGIIWSLNAYDVPNVFQYDQAVW